MMNKPLHISVSKKTLLVLMGLWAGAVAVLACTGWNPYGLFYILGVPFLFYLPGYFLVSTFIQARLDGVARTLLAVGLSILTLLVTGFIWNTLLPFLGAQRPLDTFPALVLVLLIVGGLFYEVYRQFEHATFVVPRYGIAQTGVDVLMLLFGFSGVLLSIIGALQLNHGGGNATTLILLGFIAVGVVLTFRYAEKCTTYILPTVLYLNALALLLMTSMRGWFISGHDIQREFFVFQLAKHMGVWSASTYVDAYNACLSITILPTLIANLLHVPDAYVYKVLYQLFFALVAVIVFVISSRWLQPRLAFLASILFIAFPTFFQDMPFLARQEVAFLFFGLMLYVLFEEKMTIQLRRVLFVCLGLGVILSHYSTTYTVLFVVTLTSLTLLGKKIVTRVAPGMAVPVQKITLGMVGLLVAVNLMWTIVITETGSHAKQVLGNVWVAMHDGSAGDSYSPDIFLFLTFSQGVVKKDLAEYVRNEVDVDRAHTPALFYATSTYSNYPFTPVEEAVLPATTLGTSVRMGSVTLGDLVTSFGKVFAKVMQITVLLGMVYVFVRKQWIQKFDTEFTLLALYSLLFIVLCIAVPLLSREYGVFRAVQQALFLLAPFMIVGVLVISRAFAWMYERWCVLLGLSKRTITTAYISTLASMLVVLFMLFSTGFIPQLVGGNIPAVHLNNTGNDFDHYVIEKDEELAIMWLKDRVEEDTLRNGGEAPLIQADRFGKKKLESVLSTPISGDIFPGSIQKDAYVFVGPAITEGGVAVLLYDGDLIRYRYPIEFLEAQKEKVFSTRTVQIYR